MDERSSALARRGTGAPQREVSGVGAIRSVIRELLDASARRTRRSRRAAPMPRNADYALLKAIVKERGLLARQPAYYAAVMALVAGVLAAGAGWVALARGTGWVWLAAPLLAFAAGQITLLGHEAAHRAVFAGARANDALALVCINLLNGGNHRWWRASHDEHHARSNDPERDPDADYPFLAFCEAQAAEKPAAFRFLLSRQHWVVPLLTCLVGINMRVYGFVDFARRGARRIDLAACAAFYVVYPSLLVAALGAWRGALFMALHQALYGVYLGSVTSVNHWGMPMPADGPGLDYLRRQTITSRNLRGGPLADLWFGGLNRQIEHHLFPTMARNKLAEARPVVRAFCEARGVAYHEVSIAGAYREAFSTLRRVARSVRARDATRNPLSVPLGPPPVGDREGSRAC